MNARLARLAEARVACRPVRGSVSTTNSSTTTHQRFARAGLALCVAWAGTAHGATFTVGDGPGCTHRSIQAAIDAAAANPGADTIALALRRSDEATGLSIDTTETITITGGFAQCGGGRVEGRSTIGPARGEVAPLLRIRGRAGSLVRLRGLEFSGGDVGASGRGGGIRYEGDGVLELSDSRVSGNQAQHGGGMFIDSPEGRARIVVGDGVDISGNTAKGDGGGIHASAAVVELRGHSVIAENHAGRRGGGVYLVGDTRRAQHAALMQLTNATLARNLASEGSAISLGNRAMLTAMPCTGTAPCTHILGNRTLEAGAAATSGSVLHIADGAAAEMHRTSWTDNAGRHVIDAVGDLELADSLMVANTTSAELIASAGRRDDAHHAILRNVTIAQNRIGATAVIASAKNLSLLRAIIWQPGHALLARTRARLDAVDILAHERASLGDIANRVITEDPAFVDSQGGDFRLSASSPAIDFSPIEEGTDIAGMARGIDQPEAPNRFGTGDLGAYEQPVPAGGVAATATIPSRSDIAP